MVERWPISEKRCEECENAEKEAGAKGAICLRCRNVGAGKRFGWMVGVLGRRNYAPAWCPRQKREEKEPPHNAAAIPSSVTARP